MTPSQYVRKKYPEAYSRKVEVGSETIWKISESEYSCYTIAMGLTAYKAWLNAREIIKKETNKTKTI